MTTSGYGLLAGLCALCVASSTASADGLAEAQQCGKPFWMALANDCTVPAEESPAGS
jgi:hypothetical protein